MKFLSKNVEETAEIASNFAKATLANPNFEKNRAIVVGLYGELGSGKTTFMKYLAKAFGIEETIQSPTYVIEKIYELKDKSFKHLIHIDTYRIEKDEEMINLGWQEIISDSKNLVCIEWPEKVSGIMPHHTVIKFEHAGENERKISIT
ncbi:MAG: tRNA (adenosine(37)-N6)-threonylcarbamoyltransferase complex ATPase subunit type 1 TsaE [Candidatus Zambryskibacteria bacterium CG10_big_fil_rev_8_21_14_0_10_34_34]|uniref:tRNA threonylcarbamoyladenosine biosynthesis protein TsaE n=1 Tax=Candidatus Zambryskibacteria bacterium CG10_big_fil_rev_8_21_14_0_10_34_34 TaxID=1975114 RepID=A0A2H0R259_9BACT|nr:MAG: tRNA (adenosine(37)-N6)-threonylcarbamoyltransferase complex ATPase subunit type 1 TsaE [Candidatus Zambryskibacteria bacterium CG10_big_fil_rev_8_21_14_0_10_34_34]